MFLNYKIAAYRSLPVFLSVIVLLFCCLSGTSEIKAQEGRAQAVAQPKDTKGRDFSSNGFLSPQAGLYEWPELIRRAGNKITKDFFDKRTEPRSNIISVGRNKLAFCYGDTLSIWDIEKGMELRQYERPLKSGYQSTFDDRWQLASDPDGKYIFSAILDSGEESNQIAGRDNKHRAHSDFETSRGIAVWDTLSGEQINHLLPDSRMHRLVDPQLSTDGHVLMAHQVHFRETMYSGGLGYEEVRTKNSVVLFDTKSMKKIATISLLDGYYVDARLSANGKSITVCRNKDQKTIFDNYKPDGLPPTSLQVSCISRGDTEDALGFAIDPAGRFVATSHERFICIRDAQSFQELKRIELPADVESNRMWQYMYFSEDSSRLVFTTRDSRSYVANIETASIDFELSCYCRHASFVRGGTRIAGYMYHSSCLGLFSAGDGRVLAKLFPPVAPRQWLVMTAGGSLSASDDLVQSICNYSKSIVVGAQSGEPNFSLDPFFQKYNRPLSVYAELNGVGISASRSISTEYAIPSLVIENASLVAGKLTFDVEARSSGQDVSIAEIHVCVGETSIDAGAAKLNSSPAGKKYFKSSVDLNVPPTLKVATVVVTIRDSIGGEGIPVRLQCKSDSADENKVGSRLFVLSIGVSDYNVSEFKLAYAASDAIEVANSLRRLEGIGFGSVVSEVITDKKATLENIRKGMQWLRTSCQPSDTALIFISGHGVRGRRGLYYLPHEGDPESIQSTCLNWEELTALLSGLNTSSILCLTDVCHAGAIGETSLDMQRDAADALRKNKRAIIGASSQGNQFSLELDSVKHGAFAYALCDAFSGKADDNRDGALTLLELENYCTSRVMSLTEGKQKPKFIYDSDAVGKSTLTKLAKGERKVVVLKASPIMRGSETIGSVGPGESLLVEREENGWSLGTIDLGGKKVKGWVRSADLQGE